MQWWTKKKVNDAKEEIYAKVQQDTDFIGLKNDVAAKCKAERLETYNRRENVKIVGLREDVDENGQIVRGYWGHNVIGERTC